MSEPVTQRTGEPVRAKDLGPFLEGLVGSRFQIEQDYEERKEEVGLDYFEGRSWQGWHHHLTLVTLAYAFLTLEKMGNKRNFWIDVASCPPVDPDMPDVVHGRLLHLE